MTNLSEVGREKSSEKVQSLRRRPPNLLRENCGATNWAEAQKRGRSLGAKGIKACESTAGGAAHSRGKLESAMIAVENPAERLRELTK